MGIVSAIRGEVANRWAALRGQDGSKRVGIYGVPNVGKTTFINRIARDYGLTKVGLSSEVPHETTDLQELEDITIRTAEDEVTLDIVDTPGVKSTVDRSEFAEFDITGEDAFRRENQAAEGVATAVEAVRNVDGVVLMFDATRDPTEDSVRRLVELVEEEQLPILMLANKIDDDDAEPRRVKDAYPRHEVVELSALEGYNMREGVYPRMADYFGNA